MNPFSALNHDLKERFKSDIATNIQNIIDTRGYGAISIQALEQEVIYYACDILLYQKSQEGRFPIDPVMTDIITCASTAMKELFPNNYSDVHAQFAQEGVRINLTQVPNLQQVIDDYYAKQRGGY